jgi:hypothetical protein
VRPIHPSLTPEQDRFDRTGRPKSRPVSIDAVADDVQVPSFGLDPIKIQTRHLTLAGKFTSLTLI